MPLLTVVAEDSSSLLKAGEMKSFSGVQCCRLLQNSCCSLVSVLIMDDFVESHPHENLLPTVKKMFATYCCYKTIAHPISNWLNNGGYACIQVH